MKLSHPQLLSFDTINREKTLRKIEAAAKNCYQSQCKENIEDTAKFVRGLVKSGHLSPVELGGMFNVTIKTSRNVLAELTRHRLASFCVLSQRYCKYDQGVEYIIPTHLRNIIPEGEWEDPFFEIIPSFINDSGAFEFLLSLGQAEITYQILRKEENWRAEDAREVLPGATSTIITMGANLREWKHIFDLRIKGTTGKPYSPCKETMQLVYNEFAKALPEIFEE